MPDALASSPAQQAQERLEQARHVDLFGFVQPHGLTDNNKAQAIPGEIVCAPCAPDVSCFNILRDTYFCATSMTQAMKLLVLSPLRSAMVWPRPQTVVNSTSFTPV